MIILNDAIGIVLVYEDRIQVIVSPRRRETATIQRRKIQILLPATRRRVDTRLASQRDQ